MTRTEAQQIEASMKTGNAFQLKDDNNSLSYSYFFDMVEEHFFCQVLEKEAGLKELSAFTDFSALYEKVLSKYSLEAILKNIADTMKAYQQFYAICKAEEVDLKALQQYLEIPFNYELHIWDRDKSTHGYMTAFQALLLRRPAAGKAIELLLKKGVNPNKKTGMKKSEKTAFFHACRYAHFEEVKLMLPFVDVNFILNNASPYFAPTALMCSILNFIEDSPIKKQRLNTFQLLLQAGANFNYLHTDGESAIMKIVDTRRSEYLELIPKETTIHLNYFHDSAIFHHNRYSPLGFCVRNYKREKSNQLFKALLNISADVNFADRFGMTPLFYAVEKEIPEIFESTGTLWDIKDKNGRTPLLHYASLGRNKTAVADFLLQKSVDINATDNEGNSALHLALMNKDSHLSLYLLEKGADTTQKNKDGKLVLDIAKTNKMYGIINKLEKNAEAIAIKIEELPLSILEQGFEYKFGTKHIYYRENENYGWYYYKDSHADYYAYRNYQCTKEWLKEYFTALITGSSVSEESMYFLNYINSYFVKTGVQTWSMDKLISVYKQSYMYQQIQVKVTKEDVLKASIQFLKVGHRFFKSDKEGIASYTFNKAANNFQYNENGELGKSERYYDESTFKKILLNSISLWEDNLYRVDFSGFFSRDLTNVLQFLGYSTWRAWKFNTQYPLTSDNSNKKNHPE